MKDNPNVIYPTGSSKGIYTKHSETVLSEKVQNKYDYTLQEVNDRIRSYRPNVITNYKPVGAEQLHKQQEEMNTWDGVTWDIGEYANYGDPEVSADSKLYDDLKTLVKSAAVLRGYHHPSKVRGNTPQDVDDFFNYVTIKLCERRQKQYDASSPCRILDNWPSYLATVIPQYLIAFNKSKIDYDVEAFWPLVKDERTGEYVQKDFKVDFDFRSSLASRKDFLEVVDKIIDKIPEAIGFKSDILMYLVYKTSFSNRRLISQICEVVKMQLVESQEEFV